MADIEVALRVINDKSQEDDPLYKLYQSLKCEISTLDKNDERYEVLYSKMIYYCISISRSNYNVNLVTNYEFFNEI